jgi:SAM-dependent methyltransferase
VDHLLTKAPAVHGAKPRGWRRRWLFMTAYSRLYDGLWDNALTDELAVALVDALGPQRSVLDVGAGTGLITRRLAADGYRVAATEPDARMRQRLTRRLPHVPCAQLAIEQLEEDTPMVRGSTALVAVNVVHMADDELCAVSHLRRVAADKTLIIVTPRQGIGLLVTARALLRSGLQLRKVALFVMVHMLLAPLTVITRSGLERTRIDIGGERHLVGDVFSMHVWAGAGHRADAGAPA